MGRPLSRERVLSVAGEHRRLGSIRTELRSGQPKGTWTPGPFECVCRLDGAECGDINIAHSLGWFTGCLIRMLGESPRSPPLHRRSHCCSRLAAAAHRG